MPIKPAKHPTPAKRLKRPSTARDRQVRAEMLERAKQEPQADPGDEEYFDDLAKRFGWPEAKPKA